MNTINNRVNQAGFSLIELLVVISIMSLVSSVALASFADTRRRARVAQTIANVIQTRKALETYYQDHGYYPPAEPDYQDFPAIRAALRYWARFDQSDLGSGFIPALINEKYMASPIKSPNIGDHARIIRYTDAQEYPNQAPQNSGVLALAGSCIPEIITSSAARGGGVKLDFYLDSDTKITNPNFKLCENSSATPPYLYCVCLPNPNAITDHDILN